MTQLQITQPDDWHVHLRDGDTLNHVAAFTAQQFARAIVMPNLQPPVTTVKQAVEYVDRIVSAIGDNEFEPLMTLYLTDNTSAEENALTEKSGFVKAVKL